MSCKESMFLHGNSLQNTSFKMKDFGNSSSQVFPFATPNVTLNLLSPANLSLLGLTP